MKTIIENVDETTELLEKAIDKSKLVPVVTQVTRNGKVFNKTVWKKASEVEAMKNKAPKKQDEQKSPSKKDADSGGTTSYKGFAIMKHDGESDYTIHYDEGTVYMKGLKSVDDAKSAIDNKDSKPGFDHVLPDYDEPENQSSLDFSEFERLKKSDRPAALEYLKDCGVTWEENPHPAINLMRATMAAKGSGKPSEPGNKPIPGQLAKPEKKIKVDNSSKNAEYLAGLKEKGITWEENPHPAINLMRAKMAEKKAGDTKEPPKEPVKPKEDPKPSGREPSKKTAGTKVDKSKQNPQPKAPEPDKKQSKGSELPKSLLPHPVFGKFTNPYTGEAFTGKDLPKFLNIGGRKQDISIHNGKVYGRPNGAMSSQLLSDAQIKEALKDYRPPIVPSEFKINGVVYKFNKPNTGRVDAEGNILGYDAKSRQLVRFKKEKVYTAMYKASHENAIELDKTLRAKGVIK